MRKTSGFVTAGIASALLLAGSLALSPSSSAQSLSTTVATTVPKGQIAKTPPMGWNSWNAYSCDNSAQNMEAVARFIQRSGLEKDGYTYVNADGCYDDLEGVSSPNTYGVTAPTKQDPETCGAINGRLPDGRIFLNQVAFPSSKPCADDGFKLVANYAHSLGLKFGTYLDASNNWNCEEIPGSYGFDTIDAQALAAWGVDYVKADWGCKDTTVPPASSAPSEYTGIDADSGNTGFGGPTFSTNPDYAGSQENTQIKMYTALGEALKSVSRPIVYSVAGAGTVGSETWGLSLGQLDRPTGDANTSFTATGKHAAGSVVGIINSDAQTYDAQTKPGHWIDPDPMEIGNGSLTLAQDESEMSMFSEMTQPLLMSANLCAANCGPNTTPATASQLAQDVTVFGNKRVIAVDQDPLAKPAQIVGTFDGTDLVMTKPLADGSVAVTFFNESTTQSADMSATAADLGLPAASNYTVEDLWTGGTTTSSGSIGGTVAPGATLMVRVAPAGHSTATWAGTTTNPSPTTSPTGGIDQAAYNSPANLLSVSCGSNVLCTGIDNFGRVVSFNPAAAVPRKSKAIAIDPGHTLVAVSCPAGTGECVALDSRGVEYTFQPRAARGATHVTHKTVAAHQPSALDCYTAFRCVAVDGNGNEITFSPKLHAIFATAAHAVAAPTNLLAVSCPTRNQCTASGGGGNGGDTEVTFNPQTGAVNHAGVLAVDSATGNGTTAVSCPSTKQCTVVDGSGNEVTFNPVTGVVNAAAVAPLEGSNLAAGLGVMNSVWCSTVTACVAVDASGNAVAFNPTTGVVTAAGMKNLDPAGGGLTSVTCPTSKSRCVAVDLNGRAVTFWHGGGAVRASSSIQIDPRYRMS